jgi:hypothetical protein
MWREVAPQQQSSEVGRGGGSLLQSCLDMVEYVPTYTPPAECKGAALLEALARDHEGLATSHNACMRPEITAVVHGDNIKILANGCPDHAYFQAEPSQSPGQFSKRPREFSCAAPIARRAHDAQTRRLVLGPLQRAKATARRRQKQRVGRRRASCLSRTFLTRRGRALASHRCASG